MGTIIDDQKQTLKVRLAAIKQTVNVRVVMTKSDCEYTVYDDQTQTVNVQSATTKVSL